MEWLTTRKLGRSVVQSLATRISVFVFVAALTSSLAVAGTSALSLRAFLRGKVEGKIPAAASHARDSLDLWLSQRALDIAVFARSGVLARNLSRVVRPGEEAKAPLRAEAEQYLRYVREGSPKYRSIFALDAQGRVIASAGASVALDPATLRALTSAGEASVAGVLEASDRSRYCAVSSPVVADDGRQVATLHALMPLAAVAEQLAESLEPGPSRVLAFDEHGAFVVASAEPATPVARIAPELRDAPPSVVRAYVAPGGARVVGSHVPLARLHWSLVYEETYDSAFAPIALILRRTAAMNLGIVLVFSAAAWAVVRFLVRPLSALSQVAERLRDGDESVQLPVAERRDEVGVLTRSFGEMVTSLRRANESLAQLAITDGLTKIHNHRFFQDQYARELARARRTGVPLALVLADVDDFKALNDRHGHAVGDAVLERLARFLVERVRAQDLVARYGGEEFAILALDSDLAGATRLAEKLRLAVSEHEFHIPQLAEPIRTSVSMGVAAYREGGDLFAEADRALYAAKRAGKDCVVAGGRPD